MFKRKEVIANSRERSVDGQARKTIGRTVAFTWMTTFLLAGFTIGMNFQRAKDQPIIDKLFTAVQTYKERLDQEEKMRKGKGFGIYKGNGLQKKKPNIA